MMVVFISSFLIENAISPGNEGAEHHMNGEEQVQYQDADMEEGNVF